MNTKANATTSKGYRSLLKQARHEHGQANYSQAARLAAEAVRIMENHFSSNNPVLAQAYTDLSCYRFANYMDANECGVDLPLSYLTDAIKAKEAGVAVLARGMSTDCLASHQYELAQWLEMRGSYRKSAKQLQAMIDTVRDSADSKVSTYKIILARLGIARNMRQCGHIDKATRLFAALPAVKTSALLDGDGPLAAMVIMQMVNEAAQLNRARVN